LQDGARTSLLHAIQKWPSATTINLWPYALRYANDVNNHVPTKGKDLSPIEMFSATNQKSPVKQFYHFGCPVYMLDNALQAGNRSGSKWKQRTRLGINLGFSPQHAKSVHLALSLQSGCVSPQYHCIFDNNFETLKEYKLSTSQWQQRAHFTTPTKGPTNQMEESSPGPLGEQEFLNVEQRDRMAHEERGSAELIVELEPLQQSSPPIGHDAEAFASYGA
jgi:hypothetical protein